MQYGPGHSAKLWRQYFPEAELWFGEYDSKCVEAHKKTLDDLDINVLVGDQVCGAV